MHFGYTIIYVPDVESTLHFYQKVFNLKPHFLHDSKQYGELNTGDTKLAFASEVLSLSNGMKFTTNEAHKDAPGFEIALVTQDVDQAYHHAVKAGATAIKAPATKPWGQVVAYVRDLNGILVELCSPMN